MKLQAIASAYVACVALDERAQTARSDLQEELSNLRSDLHALWMAALREAHVAFSDREDAARVAFEMVNR